MGVASVGLSSAGFLRGSPMRAFNWAVSNWVSSVGLLYVQISFCELPFLVRRVGFPFVSFLTCGFFCGLLYVNLP